MMKTGYWKRRTRSHGKKVRLMAVMDDDVSHINEVRSRFRVVLDKYRLDWELDIVSLARDESIGGDMKSGGPCMQPSPTTVASYNALPGVEKVRNQDKSEWVERWLRTFFFFFFFL